VQIAPEKDTLQAFHIMASNLPWRSSAVSEKNSDGVEINATFNGRGASVCTSATLNGNLKAETRNMSETVKAEG